MNEQPMDLRETMRGVAIRAGILAIGAVFVGGWVGAAAMKAAGTAMKVAAGGTLLLIGAGMATWEVKKVQRRFEHRHDAPALT